jgi:hypothetical protein
MYLNQPGFYHKEDISTRRDNLHRYVKRRSTVARMLASSGLGRRRDKLATCVRDIPISTGDATAVLLMDSTERHSVLLGMSG